jgi:hypothetical protein
MIFDPNIITGTRQCSGLKHYATSRMVEGLRPDEVNDI